MSVDYAWHKLNEAVGTLINGRPVPERKMARIYLTKVRQEDLPSELWDELASIKDGLLDEGFDRYDEIAVRLLKLYDDVSTLRLSEDPDLVV